MLTRRILYNHRNENLLISNGVLSKAEGSLKVSAGTGLTVTIAKGWAWINCHWFYNDNIITLDIPTVRTDTNLCGWVTGLITQVDTTTLFKQ